MVKIGPPVMSVAIMLVAYLPVDGTSVPHAAPSFVMEQLATPFPLQVISDVPPDATRTGFALMVTSEELVTVTVAMFEFTVPPEPVQLI
ncbi:MAG: hypothetical protein WA058_02590 [Minisyncoccia bacterium]